MIFQSDNGKAFIGDLAKEMMKRSRIAQTHSTTYRPQPNGMMERQNRTLVNMLRVYCARYMTDEDKKLEASGGSIQQHATLDNRDQYVHDADKQRKGNAIYLF